MSYFQKIGQQVKSYFKKSSTWNHSKSENRNFKNYLDTFKNYIISRRNESSGNNKPANFFFPKKGGALLGISLAVVLIAGLSLDSEGVPILDPVYEGYMVRIDDQEIGVVDNRETIGRMINDIEQTLREQYNENIVVEAENITFEKDEFSEKENPLTEVSELERRILASIDYNVRAYAIEIEGQGLVNLRSEKEARNLLTDLKEHFTEEDREYELVEFGETVEIQEMLVPLGAIENPENAFEILLKGTDEQQVHTVAQGDTISVIAKRYQLTTEDIEAANAHVEDIHMISIGDELNLVVPKPYLTVRTIEPLEYTEEIEFETEYNDTDALFEGDRKITQQGKIGERKISGTILRENGRQVEREIKEETILSEPVTRIVARGTAKRPTTVASGAFGTPTRGRLTSGFGPRWGTMHNGIDVAGPTGTPVNAADGGSVEFAGYRGSYGNLVIINHENGYQTYYAHLNSINVSRGTRVQKGTRIGAMGSTGRSTGPHLHFEVRRNGQPVNPLNFVNY